MKKPKYLFEMKAGAAFAVEYARTSTGLYPAEDDISGFGPQKEAQIKSLIERFHQKGKVFNKEQFKMVPDEDLFYFKRFAVRVMGYHAKSRRGVIVLTHGFEKKGGKLKKREVTRANRIREEYEEWISGQGTRRK